MKPVWWMVAASVSGWLLATGIDRDINPEVLLGMIGPLLSATVTWIVTARTHAAAPERTMSVMIAAFAVKMAFFGVYVAVILRALTMRTVPFVASFVTYLVALYVMEALFLRRLFTHGNVTGLEQ
jgi:hypothetical protein